MNSVAFSPDGKTILTGSADGTARLWNAETGSALPVLKKHTAAVNQAVFSPSGSRILTASSDETLGFWSGSGEFLTAVNYGIPVFSVAFSREGKRLLVGTGTLLLVLPPRPSVYVYDAEKGGSPLLVLGREGVDAFYVSVAYSPTEDKILTGNAAILTSGSKLWDAKTGKELFHLDLLTQVHSVAFSPDGKTALAAGSFYARLWNVSTGKEIRAFSGHNGIVNSAAFSPDGKTVLTGSADKTARLWDAATGQALRTFTGHSDEVTSVAFSPDGNRIVTGSKDKTARVWLLAASPAPSISGVSPNPVIGSKAPQTITIEGANFVNKPTVTLTWSGQTGYTVPDAQVAVVSSTELQMSITTTTTPNTWTVKVTNPDGQSSGQFTFQIIAPPLASSGGFDYPFGDRGWRNGVQYEVLEFADNTLSERNDIYPNAPRELTTAKPGRTVETGGPGWFNIQDVGAYSSELGGLHPGEDWNLAGGDAGQLVFAVANGKVVRITPTSTNGVQAWGWTIVLLHQVENYSNGVYSLYAHVAHAFNSNGTPNSMGSVDEDPSTFGLTEGQSVSRGQVIARVGAISNRQHLHLEIRKNVRDLSKGNEIWKDDIPQSGYYSDNHTKRASGMLPEEVKQAFKLMSEDEGILDASDFIDDNRPKTAVEYDVGNRVEALEAGVSIRDSAGGNPIGTTTQGMLGTVVDGRLPRVSVSGKEYRWYEIKWDNGLTGWIAEGFVARTSPPDDSCACPAKYLSQCSEGAALGVLSESSNSSRKKASVAEIDLSLIRRFRDEVLSATPEGRSLIGNFYRHSPEILRYLVADPQLRELSVDAIVAIEPTLQDMAGGSGNLVLTSENVNAVEGMIQKLSEVAGAELKSAIVEELSRVGTLDGLAGKTSTEAQRLVLGLPLKMREPRITLNGAFEFTVTGDLSRSLHVQSSDDLRNWNTLNLRPVQALPATLRDEQPVTGRQRYYRVVLTP
ncbi:MAG: peptidoglycan DD-metalloendopeptidase family protein [Verrucomicrobia bacterium]|nr:peptidoglycan DD-metalloendopeptidase family protein [Verrucomicrobiota bacterium]